MSGAIAERVLEFVTHLTGCVVRQPLRVVWYSSNYPLTRLCRISGAVSYRAKSLMC